MKLALALALLPGVSAQQQHMLGPQGPTIALDRFAGFDTGAGPLSYAELPAAARTLDGKFSKYDHRKLPAKQSEHDGKAAYQAAFDGNVVADQAAFDGDVVAERSKQDDIVVAENGEEIFRGCFRCGQQIPSATGHWLKGPAGPRTLCSCCGTRFGRGLSFTRPQRV